MTDTQNEKNSNYLGVGAGLGIAIGAGLGAAFGNVAIGIALGLVFGGAIFAAIGGKRAKQAQQSSDEDNSRGG